MDELNEQQRKEEKLILKRLRQRVRQLNNEYNEETMDAEKLQEFCLGSTAPDLEFLCEQIEGAVALRDGSSAEGEGGGRVSDVIKAAIRRREEQLAAQKEAKRVQLAEKLAGKISANGGPGGGAVAANEWTTSEISLLAKGLQKFPGGMPRRWRLISELIGTRTTEQVVDKARELAQDSSLKSMGSQINKVAFEQFRQDHEKESEKSKDRERLYKDGRPAEEQSCDSAAEPSPEAVPTPPCETPDNSGWTKAQQKALEAALVECPPSMAPKDRWSAISDRVPEKSPKECFGRFKEIREAIMSKRK